MGGGGANASATARRSSHGRPQAPEAPHVPSIAWHVHIERCKLVAAKQMSDYACAALASCFL